MDITLYSNYSKEKNSTDIPTGIGRTMDGVTREPFSILSPVIGLQFPPDYFPGEYNYMYAPELSRYYYITDWTYSGGLWYASCSVDAIASWRDDILNSWMFVVRSEAKCNPYISDATYTPTQQAVFQTSPAIGYDWKGSFVDGDVVVGIINDDENAIGAVTYYVFSTYDIRNFCSQLLLNSDYLEIDANELYPSLTHILFNPFQYIASAYWFPFDVIRGERVLSPSVGWWTIPSVTFANRLPESGYAFYSLTFRILQHPLYSEWTKYLASEPFSSAVLFVPGFGEIEVPLASFVDQFDNPDTPPVLYCRIHVDYITGRAIMTLMNQQTGQAICTREAQIGVPLQLSSMTIDSSGVQGTATGLGFGVLNGVNYALSMFNNPTASAIGGALLGGLVQRAATVESMGTNGMISQFNTPPELRFQFQMMASTYAPHTFGFPYCSKAWLRDCPGFVKVIPEDFVTAATPAERAIIENAMRDGMYISRFEDE